MALTTTPTIAICLVAGIAAGVALARPGNDPATPTAADPVAEVQSAEPAADDPYAGLGEAAEATQAPAAEPTAAAAPAAISIEGFAFAGQMTVARGASIEVTNLDGAPHTLTADDGSFNTGNLDQNQVGVITAPSTPGTSSFFCAIHPSMTGTLTVG